jgi:DNA-binding NarL/FixJ family response regulator
MGIRVLIADDHRLTMEAVKGYLAREDGIKVVAEARSGRQALALVARANPDVALIDMHMPGAMDGLTCAERTRRNFPETKVVVMSAFADEAAVRVAFRRGAHAFISKAIDPRDLGSALRQTVQGTVFLAPWVNEAESEEWLEGLTKRELSVLKAMAGGLSNRDIGQRLWVSEHTVKFHLTNIFRKLEVANRTEAARWAHQRGLVQDLGSEPVEIGSAPVAILEGRTRPMRTQHRG